MTFRTLIISLAIAILLTVGGLSKALAAEVDQAVDLRQNGVYVVDNVLYVRGTTTQYQFRLVQEQLSKGDIRRVVLSGRGGDLMAGFAIGMAIKEAGVPTQITSGTECVSACAYAALGGTKVLIGGKLLFHRGYIPQVPVMVTLDKLAQVNQRIAVMSTHYLIRMGYSTMMSYQIAAVTSPCRFMMVDSTIALRNAKSTDPLEGEALKHEDYDYCEAAR